MGPISLSPDPFDHKQHFGNSRAGTFGSSWPQIDSVRDVPVVAACAAPAASVH